jgi:2-succinyl-5-enolpyruvyl-6-hydroxy-3-cyclohexene-1-carboxylate synthase
LLINNHGGGEFYIGPRPETLDLHIAAKHDTSAKGWIEQTGFIYLSAENEAEYQMNINRFVSAEAERPMIFEVFTNMKTDADTVNLLFETNRGIFDINITDTLKRTVRSVLGENGYTTIKNTVKQIIKK